MIHARLLHFLWQWKELGNLLIHYLLIYQRIWWHTIMKSFDVNRLQHAFDSCWEPERLTKRYIMIGRISQWDYVSYTLSVRLDKCTIELANKLKFMSGMKSNFFEILFPLLLLFIHFLIPICSTIYLLNLEILCISPASNNVWNSACSAN